MLSGYMSPETIHLPEQETTPAPTSGIITKRPQLGIIPFLPSLNGLSHLCCDEGLCPGSSLVVIKIRDVMLLAEAPLASHVSGRAAGAM